MPHPEQPPYQPSPLPPHRPPYGPYPPDPRVRALKTKVRVLTAVVVVAPLAILAFFLVGLPFLNQLAAGDYHNDEGDKVVANGLIEHAVAMIDVPHRVVTISTESEVCGSVSRTDPDATFSVTASAPLKGVSPDDHTKVADEIAAEWPGLLVKYQAGVEWTVSVSWDSPTSTTGRISTHADCPPSAP